MKQLSFLLFLLINGVILESSWAHGSKITYTQTSAIAIQASFEDGTAMANAQTVVYAPEDPTTPWLTGVTDEQGQFTFIPDPNLSGNWDVKVRQAGHGDIITIPIVEGKVASNQEPTTVKKEQIDPNQESKSYISEKQAVVPSKNLTPWQKLLMTVTSVWGFIGTALFFSRNQHLAKHN